MDAYRKGMGNIRTQPSREAREQEPATASCAGRSTETLTCCSIFRRERQNSQKLVQTFIPGKLLPNRFVSAEHSFYAAANTIASIAPLSSIARRAPFTTHAGCSQLAYALRSASRSADCTWPRRGCTVTGCGQTPAFRGAALARTARPHRKTTPCSQYAPHRTNKSAPAKMADNHMAAAAGATQSSARWQTGRHQCSSRAGSRLPARCAARRARKAVRYTRSRPTICCRESGRAARAKIACRTRHTGRSEESASMETGPAAQSGSSPCGTARWSGVDGMTPWGAGTAR
eukprot:ctg_840.g195